MNLWDYYEWEIKKSGRGVNYTLKIASTTGKWFQQYVGGIHYYFTNNYMLIFTMKKCEEISCEE